MNLPITLHPVNRDHPRANRYCGPAVISVLTGLNTFETAYHIRRVSGKRSVKGTSSYHLKITLNSMGYVMLRAHWYNEKQTFAQWARNPNRDTHKTYVIVSGNHWVVVQGRRCCCGLMKEITPITQSIRRRARVTEVYEVYHTEKVKIEPVEAQKKEVRRNETKREALKLARKNGIKVEDDTYERDNPKWYVTGPDWFEDDEDLNPFYGDHYCFTWEEVLERVKDIIKVIEEAEKNAANPS